MSGSNRHQISFRKLDCDSYKEKQLLCFVYFMNTGSVQYSNKMQCHLRPGDLKAMVLDFTYPSVWIEKVVKYELSYGIHSSM